MAVVRITSDATGQRLREPPHLPTLKLAGRGGIDRGDTVYVVGYPEISGGEAQRISSGSVAALLDEERLSGHGTIIDTTAAVTPGNSGGAAVDSDGHLIGVPMASRPDSRDPVTAGLLRPAELAEPLLRRARSRSPGPYVTPYVQRPTGEERASLLGWATPTEEGACPVSQSASAVPAGTTTLCAVLSVSGMDTGLDVDVALPDANAHNSIKADGENQITAFFTLDDPVTTSLRYQVDVGGGTERLLTGTVEVVGAQ